MAVDTAPRISDMEIITQLTELKAGQTALNQRFEDQIKSINQRFEAVDKRFEAVDKRFDAVDKRFDAVDKRFDDVADKMDMIWNLMLVVIAGIFGLIGFIVWDRKTALRPLERRLDSLEKDLQNDLEIRHKDGSLMTRLVKALQELSKQDEKLAGVLRSISLL